MDDSLRKVETDKAPIPVGPYSQAVVAGDFVFLAGQIGQDPMTGKLVSGGIRPETERTIDNIAAALNAISRDLGSVCSVDVSLVNLEDLDLFNEVYATRFSGGAYPARRMREASKLTMGASVEIGCTAYLGRTAPL